MAESSSYGGLKDWEFENLLQKTDSYPDDVELTDALRKKKQSATQLNRYLIIGLAALATLAVTTRIVLSTQKGDISPPDFVSAEIFATDVFKSVNSEVYDNSLPIFTEIGFTTAKDVHVRANYECSSASDCDMMITPWMEVSEGSSALQLHRLRAHTEYIVHLQYRLDDSDDVTVGATLKVQTGSTGNSRLDAHPFATVDGNAGFATYVTERAGEGFYGFIGIDSAGYVVWGANFSYGDYVSSIGDLPSHAIDQFPDHSFAVLLQGSKQLFQMQPNGAVVEDPWHPTYPSACSALTHEVFIDKSNLESASSMSDLPILSLQHEVVTLEGSVEPYTLAQKLVRWNRTEGSNVMEVIFDIFEVLSPDMPYWEDPFFPGFLSCTQDDGGYGTFQMADFSHCNSAAVGTRNNYLVSSRATSTVISVARDGSGVQWAVSSSVDLTSTVNTTFAFPDMEMMWYNQHFVRQLDSGNIILIDNGNTRPTMNDGDSSFSRAVEYELDFDTGLITKVWEFAPEGVFSVEGGSIDVLENGNRLVTFPFVTQGGTDTALVFEVDTDGKAVANVTVPWLSNSSVYDTPTRGIALNSIAGETVEPSVTSRRR